MQRSKNPAAHRTGCSLHSTLSTFSTTIPQNRQAPARVVTRTPAPCGRPARARRCGTVTAGSRSQRERRATRRNIVVQLRRGPRGPAPVRPWRKAHADCLRFDTSSSIIRVLTSRRNQGSASWTRGIATRMRSSTTTWGSNGRDRLSGADMLTGHLIRSARR